ncbi:MULTISPECIES: restriction endonuclease subunit S [Xanthomonas]|uniref:Type I restriction modification DNA specificity domain-containing protein n=1 Tax=Xanthomonas hortorum pv. gardneri TaxID=2754056 RepID=A0A6V7CEC3_9XANT|nr:MULTISPECIES: restriction endonuclease subunit S [Xanthomonas]APP81506.1 restriction endonuclease subunit S [Xanthomonas hortorum pv. gardneri]EGD20990.1 restriction endonuclease S subunit [Xanthomonas hortorum ATCC 19865]KLA93747.1 restriction endonuclease S subunit [Xanthomonas hortorum pv. gardneri]KLA97979.1 restriction endonuclease S subunit [Xanthomonas hortorum pv. gardneri]KLB00201.1 restriction endonuclease S subunit [Xanthomonas hortorum pv. gardneri]
MISPGWSQHPLGDIAKVTSGGTPDRSTPSYWGGNIPWITTGEVQFNTITDSAEKITELGLKNSSAKLFPIGTLLVAMYGQGKTRGQIAKLGIEAATNQACAAILFDARNDPDFHFQYLASQYEELRELGNAGTQKNLNGGILKRILVPVPPIQEQRRIAHILSTWDQAIATTERLLANACTQRKTLTNALFVHGRHSSMTTHGWKFADLDEVFERVTRRNTTANSNVLTISGTRGLVSQRDYFNKSVASENLSGYTLIERGEFAYNKSYSAGYPMGAIKPLTRYDQGVVSSLYICFRLRDGVEADADFFRHYFEVGMLNEGLSGIAQEGARNHGLLNVGVGDFFKLRLHIPDVTEQRRVAAILNMAEQKEQLITAQLDKLRDEKKALMSQLLTGKRRVRLPADEAAHA